MSGERDTTPGAVNSLQLLSYQSAGDLLAVSKTTIRRLVANGELPAVCMGHKNKRIPLAALSAFIAGATTQGKNEHN